MLAWLPVSTPHHALCCDSARPVGLTTALTLWVDEDAAACGRQSNRAAHGLITLYRPPRCRISVTLCSLEPLTPTGPPRTQPRPGPGAGRPLPGHGHGGPHAAPPLLTQVMRQLLAHPGASAPDQFSREGKDHGERSCSGFHRHRSALGRRHARPVHRRSDPRVGRWRNSPFWKQARRNSLAGLWISMLRTRTRTLPQYAPTCSAAPTKRWERAPPGRCCRPSSRTCPSGLGGAAMSRPGRCGSGFWPVRMRTCGSRHG
ncbi:hypothetical protein ACIBJF_42330 [Streptomyces sp. NPDC050743]|uniref:hypothetical protein n=1 Tax=Streptomyces sp. NPDC050743 TaxID=3365634 RepID=UPI0037B5C58B